LTDPGETMSKKLFVIILLVFGAFGVALFAVVFGTTGGLVTTADAFFSALEQGDYDTAYASLSEEFHGNTTIEELRSFAQESALVECSDSTWRDRSVSGDEGFLDGEVQTKSGQSIPVSVALLKENNDWKIYQIDWFTDEPAE
jgi:hypothetical protein